MKSKVFICAFCALLSLAGAVSSAGAETAAEFYKGKVIKLLVGYGAGGGYDFYARMLAPHLERQLDATVVVENRPGGGGIVALNQLVAAKPDGLTIMLISSGSAAFAQLAEAEGVRYDVDSLGHLGRVSEQRRSILWSARSPYRTLADAQNTDRTILFGGISGSDTVTATTAFLIEALGLNARIITGYKGSKEVALAAIRGEVDGFAVSAGSAKRYLRDDNLVAAVVLSRDRSPLLPDVPTIFELLELTPEQAWWVDYTDALMRLGRSLVTTPDIPADRLAFLQDAVGTVLTDPQVIAEAESKKRPVIYASPDEAKRLIDRVIARLTAEELARVRVVGLEKFR